MLFCVEFLIVETGSLAEKEVFGRICRIIYGIRDLQGGKNDFTY